MCEGFVVGLVGSVAVVHVDSSPWVSWGSMTGCSNHPAERVEVGGAAVSTDLEVGSAGRYCVVLVGMGDVVADVIVGERLDHSQTLTWGGSVEKGLGMSMSVALMGAVGRMMTLLQILMVRLPSA